MKMPRLAWPGHPTTVRRIRLLLLSGLVLVLGLGITVGLWQTTREEAERALEEEFQFWADNVASGTTDRLNGYVSVLRGVVGLFDASISVSREEFRRYVEALRLEQRCPGIQGVRFSVFVPADQKAEHVAAVRGEGFPDYDIRPEGERVYYAPVIYREPFAGRNLPALGNDIAADPVRWEAAERARDRGSATLTGKVAPQQEGTADSQPPALMFQPVYRPGAPHDTIEDRRANLLGWTYAPLRARELVRDVLTGIDVGRLQSMLQVEIYDGDLVAPDARLFPSDRAAAGASLHGGLQAVRRLEFGGRQWTLVVIADRQFEARRQSDKATLIALGGGVGSLLLALFVGVQSLNQMRVADALAEADRVNQQLAERERELLWAQRTAQLGSWTYDPDTGRTIWSEGMFRIWGLDPEEGVPDRAEQRRFIHPDDLARCDAAVDAARERGEPYRLELRILRPDGQEHTLVAICTPQRDAQGRVVRISGTNQDITERVRLQEALREQAITDPLTGLYNRRYLDETLPREMAHCRRTGESLVVAMVDLDHFKPLNDVYGHEAGDNVLRAVGELLRRCLRSGDLSCRYGGDEFTVVLSGARLEDARARLEELRETVMQMPIRYCEGDLPRVTVSAGLAAALPEETDASALLRRADAALYQAKATGRNRVVVAADSSAGGGFG